MKKLILLLCIIAVAGAISYCTSPLGTIKTADGKIVSVERTDSTWVFKFAFKGEGNLSQELDRLVNGKEADFKVLKLQLERQGTTAFGGQGTLMIKTK